MEFDLELSFRWGCPEEHHDTKCVIERIKDLQEWLKNTGVSRILVAGKMGSGKTTFIKGLTSKFVPSLDPLLPHTTEVTAYEGCHEGFCFIFFDTPGLKDSEYANDYEYLSEMVKNSGEPNLLIFAIKMDDYVIEEEDKEVIGNVTKAFGWKVWQKAMFILTFANRLEKVGEPPDGVKSTNYFSETFDMHHTSIVNALEAQNVDKEVINKIDVVPVGVISEPIIPAHSLGKSWIDNFWKKAYKTLLKPKQADDNVERQESSHEKSQMPFSDEKEHETVASLPVSSSFCDAPPSNLGASSKQSTTSGSSTTTNK